MHFMEVNVEEIDSFRFTLPVHFIGLDGEEMLQFTVEFGESMKEKGNLVFNVWCGYPGARIRAFLMTATVKTNGAPVDAIMNYLQKSDEFSEMSREFISHFSKSPIRFHVLGDANTLYCRGSKLLRNTKRNWEFPNKLREPAAPWCGRLPF